MPRNTRSATERRNVLAGAGAALLGGTFASGQAAADTTTIRVQQGTETSGMPAPEYAIFTELSPDSKLMKDGWNTRVFTNTDTQKGRGITCDFTTGIVTLARGIYHVTGLSMVAYATGGEPPEMTTIRAPASAGYCRLRSFDPDRVLAPGLRGIENDDPSIISIGSPSTANLTPSLLEAYYETDKPAQIILEHQSGSHPEQIYLRVYVENSKWHAMARLSIRRIGGA